MKEGVEVNVAKEVTSFILAILNLCSFTERGGQNSKTMVPSYCG
ncbi:hypothetical protein PO124_17615 [Bacillus licheniformis]|nr:hypothetical protein [Bacillus licheniformis]